MDQKLKSFVIALLRRGSYRWYGRYTALNNSKIARNQYVCAICKKVFGRKDIQLDHIVPLVDPKIGFTTWDSYIEKLFVGPEGYQTVCKPDHKEKTRKENEERKMIRQQKKKLGNKKC